MNGRENQVRVVLKRTENAYDSASFGPTGREHLSESSLSEIDRLIVKTSLAVIEEYDARIERLEAVEAEVSASLRWVPVQVAHVSVWYDEYLGNSYTRLKRRRNHQIAIVATARKEVNG